MGIHYVYDLARTIPIESSIEIKSRSVMGTEIPLVRYESQTNAPAYDFMSTKESVSYTHLDVYKRQDQHHFLRPYRSLCFKPRRYDAGCTDVS